MPLLDFDIESFLNKSTETDHEELCHGDVDNTSFDIDEFLNDRSGQINLEPPSNVNNIIQ